MPAGATASTEGLRPGRQRLAFECLDSTERAPHLAGALGDAVADALAAAGGYGARRTAE